MHHENIIFEGDIAVIDDAKAITAALNKLKDEKVLGFDTESKPSFRKGKNNLPCLIQLAGKDFVAIFRLHYTGFTNELKQILENENVIKTGSGIINDLEELNQISPFNPRGFVELNDVEVDLGVCGLKGLSEYLFDKKLCKAQARKNWAVPNLTQAQINYAATDAWIGREIYLTLANRGHSFDKIDTVEMEYRRVIRLLRQKKYILERNLRKAAIKAIFQRLSISDTKYNNKKLIAKIKHDFHDQGIVLSKIKLETMLKMLMRINAVFISKGAEHHYLYVQSGSYEPILTMYETRIIKKAASLIDSKFDEHKQAIINKIESKLELFTSNDS